MTCEEGRSPAKSALIRRILSNYPGPPGYGWAIFSCMIEAVALSIDDVIPAVDVEGLTRDQACGIESQKCDRDAHVIDADKTSRGCLGLSLVSSRWNSAILEAARVAKGPGEMAWTRIPLGPSSAAR